MELNLIKCKFFDKTRDKYIDPEKINEILTKLEIEKGDSQYWLSKSDYQDFQLHSKRLPNFCFFNNYFRHGLHAWQANTNIQPDFNCCKTVTYMFTCLPKTGR